MKLVFNVCTGQCGSTLLNEILAKHENLRFISTFMEKHTKKLDNLGAWASEIYRTKKLAGFYKTATQFRPTEAYLLIRKKFSPVYVQPSRDLAAFDITPLLEQRFRDFICK